MKTNDYKTILGGIAAIAVIILVFGKFSPATHAEAPITEAAPLQNSLLGALDRLHTESATDWPDLGAAVTPNVSESDDFVSVTVGDHIAVGVKEGVAGLVGRLPHFDLPSLLYGYTVVDGDRVFTVPAPPWQVACKSVTNRNGLEVTLQADIEALCKN